MDDQEFFRGVLCDLVSTTPGFRVVGEAASGEDAMPATDALSPQFVLMDVRMPGCGGIEAARVLTRRHPDLVVLLVSAQEPSGVHASDFPDSAVSFVNKRRLRAIVLREVWETWTRVG